MDAEVAVVGAESWVLRRRSPWRAAGARVVLLEAEAEPGLGASGTNSGILHTGFDSTPGELETELILRSAELRDELLAALELPICAAAPSCVPPTTRSARRSPPWPAARIGTASRRSCATTARCRSPARRSPIRWPTRSRLAAAAERHGADVRTGFRVEAVRRADGGVTVAEPGGEAVAVRVVVNCAGLRADEVAAAGGRPVLRDLPAQGRVPGLRRRRPARSSERILPPGPERRHQGGAGLPDARRQGGGRARPRSTSRTRTIGASGRRRPTRSCPRPRRCCRWLEDRGADRRLRRAAARRRPGRQLPDRAIRGDCRGSINVGGDPIDRAHRVAGDRRARLRARRRCRRGARRARAARAAARDRPRPGPWWRRTAAWHASGAPSEPR